VGRVIARSAGLIKLKEERKVRGEKCIDEATRALRREEWSKNAHRLNEISSFSFDTKVEMSREAIRDALKDHGGEPIISSSFGKDSMALTHLVHSVDPTVPINFIQTGQEFPGTIKYKDEMIKKYNLTVYELRPEKTYWEIVKEHGYPKSSRNSKTGDKREPACCRILKHEPMKKFFAEYCPTLNFVGLVGDEGRYRRMPYIVNGSATYYMKTLDIWKCIPLIWWTRGDVWMYHDVYGIPRNPVYAQYGLDRTGCMACTGHIGWQDDLQKVSFPLYRRVSRGMGRPVLEEWVKDKRDVEKGVVDKGGMDNEQAGETEEDKRQQQVS
jgi:phosphoadenosine phosphosulfate reductase